MFLWISMNSCLLSLLLVPGHHAEVIIVKRLIQERINVSRVNVKSRSSDQGRRKNNAFALSATPPTLYYVDFGDFLESKNVFLDRRDHDDYKPRQKQKQTKKKSKKRRKKRVRKDFKIKTS